MTSLTCSSRHARTQRVHWMQASRCTSIAGCERSSAGCGQELDRHLLTDDGARTVGRHLHAVFRIAAARRREHALAFDLDHAGAAVAVGPHALHVAESRDVDAVLAGNLQDGAVVARGDALAVEREGRHHSISAGKYFSTDSTGLGAA